MKITIEIPDAEFHAIVAAQVAAAIVDVMRCHQTQNLAAIKDASRAAIKEVFTTDITTLSMGTIGNAIDLGEDMVVKHR